MEKNSVRKLGIFFVVMMILFLGSAIGIVQEQKRAAQGIQENSDHVAIYPESGFFNKDIQVQITAPKGAVVCYTLNCEEPVLEGTRYTAPILLKAEEEETAYILRAKVFLADGSSSEVYTRTYLCGRNIQNRYNTTVVSLVGEPEGLFGYENGILVNGKRYDEFMKEHPGVHPGGGVDANFTMRGEAAERPVSIEIFDQTGKKIIGQQGGIRVAGQLSRLNNHKSLRLYARSEYDVKNEFDYDFWGDLYSMEDGTLGKSYKRLLLKNSGQDYGYGFVRTELVNRLADQAGFPDTQHATPTCVYINGAYYGSYWLENSFDREYFVNRYGEHDGQFVVIEGGDQLKEASEDADITEKQCVSEFNDEYNRFAQMDLTDDENYKALQEFLDVENYLQYFAIENYVGNDDWPDANVKAYRYLAGESGYGESSFDGRYRMLLFDADYGFGLLFYYETIGCLVNEMTLDKIMFDKSPLFAALMEREDCRTYFTSYTLDLINGAMQEENVSAEVDRLHASREQELANTLSEEGLVGGFLLDPDSLNMETVAWNVERIKAYAKERPKYVLQDIEEKFQYREPIHLTVSWDKSDGSVRINRVCSDTGFFEGNYLKEIPIMLQPVLQKGNRFVGWRIDGRIYLSETLVLTDEMLTRDTLEVELVTETIGEPRLQLTAVAAKGKEDYIELTNVSGAMVSTEGYYLSDGKDPYQYALPVQMLSPGESIHLVGKNNDSLDSLGKYMMNFDLKEGEILTVTYLSEQIDSVEIPDMSKDGVMVRNVSKGMFVEKKREQ